jgi:hypothetical protein
VTVWHWAMLYAGAALAWFWLLWWLAGKSVWRRCVAAGIGLAALAALWTKLAMPLEPWAALTFVLGVCIFPAMLLAYFRP